MSGVLLREVDDFIQRMMSEGGDSAVKGRLCALIFLISQMSQPVLGGETGLRATAPFLADLLVEDLAEDGARLRKRVPELLDELVADGRIVQDVDDEYRLLTQEDAEWEKDYRTRLAAVRDDATRMSQLRSERLIAAVEAALGNLKLTHGTSKTPRKLDIHWGQDEPAVDDGDVPVWMRDEWSATESAVKKAAAEAGDESPIVFVFLPKSRKRPHQDALASSRRRRGDPAPADPADRRGQGRAAGDGIAPRPTTSEMVVALFGDVVARARVFQGGGTELTTTSSLRDAVETAANRSLIRLFPKFAQGDNANWGKVVTKARDGAPDALDAVGHHGEPTTHPVCKEVLAAISPGGTKGAELQKRFAGAAVRLAEGRRERGRPRPARRREHPRRPGREGSRRPEGAPADPDRQGHALQGGRAAERAAAPRRARAPDRGRDLLRAGSGGSAAPCPPPAAQGPRRPRRRCAAPARATGHRPPRRACWRSAETSASAHVADDHERLSADLERWRAAAAAVRSARPRWRDLERLLRHADGLPVAEAVAPAVAAIRDGRQLLDDPDPIAPLLTELVAALRAEVTQRARAARRRPARRGRRARSMARVEQARPRRP